MSLKVDKWTIETAQMKHTARRISMSNVAQNHLRKLAAIAGVDDYKSMLEGVQSDPAQYETLTDEQRDLYDVSSFVSVWAAFAACIVPYIHLEDWLAMDYQTIDKITEGVQSVNPHWFETPDQEKKTDEPLPKSMND